MDAIERADQENDVIRALIGKDKRLWRLYDNSPEFHQGIKMLARTLPAFVKVMAQDAESTEAREQELVELMMRRPPKTFLPDEVMQKAPKSLPPEEQL